MPLSNTTKYPGGVLSFGIPQLGNGDIPTTTGSVFFVHSGTGSNSNSGLEPTRALATIDAAVDKCTASKGDIILVMPGHAENISAATTLVVDKAGVHIIGLGTGRNRPVLTFTNTAGSIELDAANCLVRNLVLVASVSAVVVGVNVDANDITLEQIEFNFDETGDDFVTMIDADTVSRFTCQGCRCVAEETAGCAEAIRLDTAHYTSIIGCYFSGDYTDSVIVGEGAASIEMVIADNTIYNSDATAGNCVDLNVACTGILARNSMATAYAGAEDNVFDPGSCQSIQNFVSGGTDRNAVEVPVTGSVPWRVAIKRSSVFDGATGDAHGDTAGTSNPYTLFTVTGDVEVRLVGICNTNLTGAGTLEVGVAGNTAQLIGQIADATTLDDGDVYTDAGTEAGADVFPEQSQVVNDGADIIETCGTTDITAGQIDYYCIWRPLEAGSFVVAA